MEWLEAHSVVFGALTFSVGLVIAFVSNYFMFGVDIAFIKGQLSEIIKANDAVADMAEKYAKIDLAWEHNTQDLEGMELRVKFLESKLLNGRHHG